MMGGDTDTIGAVAGTIAGARFGIKSLPDRWLEAIDKTDELKRFGVILSHEPFSMASAAEILCTNGELDL